MAEAKPKGSPVFLEIPATGETITLPGVTSLSNDDELKAAADAWIAKNYKGPLLAAPIVARTPVEGETQGILPGEEIKVTANRQPELKAYVPDTFAGSILDAIASGATFVSGLIPGYDFERGNFVYQDERDAALYGSEVRRNIETLLGLEGTERSFRDIAAGRGTGEDYLIAGLTAAPFAAVGLKAGAKRIAPEFSATVSRLATGPVAVADEIAAAVPETALSPEMAAVATPITPAPVVPSTLPRARAVELPEAPATGTGTGTVSKGKFTLDDLLEAPATGTRAASKGKFTFDDLLEAPVAAAAIPEAAPLTGTGAVSKGKFTFDDLLEAPEAAAIPEAAVAPRNVAYDLPASTPETGVPAIEAMQVKGQTQPVPTAEIGGKVANFAADYSNLAGLQRPADMPFSEFFYRHFKAGTLPEEEVSKLVTKYDLKDEDLFELITGSRQGLGDAARVMQRFSIASRYVPKEAADIAKLGLQEADDLGFWKRFTNVYRGALVSSVATTMRNVISSVGRVPIDAATNLMDSAVNAAANPFRQQKVGVSPFDAAALLTDRFAPGRNTKFWEQMKNVQPEIQKELAATYAADVARVTKKDAFAKVEKAVDVANLLNRVTETATRKALFPVMLRREATRLNLDFDELVDTGGIARLPEEAWAKALDDTLGFTYSAKSEVADKFSQMLDKMGKVGTVARVVGTTIMPFPRFMMNAMKFQFDYSPAGFTKLLTEAERAKFAKGDVSAVSKAIVGSSMLYGAYQFRNSENAGEKWYEAKLPDGRTVDLRPFFPAAPYLLIADVIKRSQDNTLDQAFETKDILQGLSGAQFRAGTGLYVTDQLLKDLSGASGNLDKAKTITASWLADVGAAFLQPFSTFKDFYAQYDPEEAIYRDTKDNPLAALARPLPGVQQAMGVPAAPSATREGPMTTEDPALRQLLGATIRPAKNIVESELDRLGLTPYDVGSKTGEVAIDRLVNRDLGIIAERGIAPLLQSPEYQNLDNVGKSAAIKEIYSKARAAATAKFNAENPELALLKKFKGMNREEKIMLNRQIESTTGMTADTLLRQLSKAPLIKSQEQFDALPVGTQYTDPGDYKVYTKGK
jgi:hypothetical protein